IAGPNCQDTKMSTSWPTPECRLILRFTTLCEKNVGHKSRPPTYHQTLMFIETALYPSARLWSATRDGADTVGRCDRFTVPDAAAGAEHAAGGGREESARTPLRRDG